MTDGLIATDGVSGTDAAATKVFRTELVGWPGASQPPAPTDPGVTLARHRALLTSWSVRVDPPPVGEQAGLSLE